MSIKIPLRSYLVIGVTAMGLALGASAQNFEGTWESLGQYKCPEWFRDAKLGIFLHWGPSSVAAVDSWYGRNMYVQGHPAYEYHVKAFGHPSKFGFKDLIQLWKAEKFDPGRLVGVFKRAGAGYIVPVASFHDNFDLWDSTYQRWNAVKMGPKRDIVALWRKAALERGLRFGASTHMDRTLSWFNTSKGSDKTGPLAGVPYDGSDPEFADLYGPKNDEDPAWPYLPKNAPESWRKAWAVRTRDLIDKYHPDLLYFDGGIPYVDVGLPLVAHFYNENQRWNGGRLEAVLNLKKTKVSGAYREGMCVQDLERSKLEGIKLEPWQTDTSIGPWFYERGARYETPGAVIDMFVDIVSKNGNLLLNIPLKADGTLDSEADSLLAEMAKWVAVNGEAIFGTRPWIVHGEGPTLVQEGYSEEITESFTSQDFRFTTKGTTIYAACLDWPAQRAVIKSLSVLRPDEIRSVRMLGVDQDLEWTLDGEGLSIKRPENRPCEHSVVFKIVRN